MPSATFHFPTGFLWGTATAAYQVEGNNQNADWSVWEKTPGKIIENQTSGLACDWWSGRWREDMDRAQLTHQNAHRLSIEWSRIQPEINRWDEDAIDRYRSILMGMHERGIFPIITLHHFTEPVWVSELGGWENEEIVKYFDSFTSKVVEAFKDYCTYWIPINEPNVLAHQAYIEGNFPPGKQSLSASFSALENMVKAHIRAYESIKRISSVNRVGTAINYRAFWPYNHNNPFDIWMANFLDNQFNNAFINAIDNGRLKYALKSSKISDPGHYFDFVGLNYYSGDRVRFNLFNPSELFHDRSYPENSLISETGFIANLPEGFEKSLKWAARFNKTILVTENGVEDSRDDFRPRYIVEHIHKLWRAANLNPLVKGYFHWSLVDNFEWERGWTQRFGLWRLNIKDQTRIRTKSVDLYAQICRTNSLSAAMVEEYAPDVYQKIFPG
jgi:beta-glucosidase